MLWIVLITHLAKKVKSPLSIVVRHTPLDNVKAVEVEKVDELVGQTAVSRASNSLLI
jgi:hypothetical protein